MRTRDNSQRFLIESCDVRGQIVQLDQTWHEALARVDYPPQIREVLGEAFVAALLLAGTIKFEGRMTLQVRGQGNVRLLVVQVSADRKVRGLARWDEDSVVGDGEAVVTAADNIEPAIPVDDSEAGLAALFGHDARLVITIEARKDAEPYQGIVALEGESLSDALANYFRDSEQLQTALHFSVDEKAAAGLLLQKLPVSERRSDDADGWQRASILADTVTDEELRENDVSRILHTLFHDEQVRLFDESAVEFACNCSRERTSAMLEGLGEAEVQSIIAERGWVEITCEFCDAEYRYDAVDVAALFHATAVTDARDGPAERPH